MMTAAILAGTIPTTREFSLRGQNLGPKSFVVSLSACRRYRAAPEVVA